MPDTRHTDRSDTTSFRQRLPGKLMRLFARGGRHAVEKALWLHFALRHPATPAWARRVIYAALAYFVFPLDLIPDLAPLIGYTDDLGVMTAALGLVAMHITPEVRLQAAERMQQWFPEGRRPQQPFRPRHE